MAAKYEDWDALVDIINKYDPNGTKCGYKSNYGYTGQRDSDWFIRIDGVIYITRPDDVWVLESMYDENTFTITCSGIGMFKWLFEKFIAEYFCDD